MSDWRQTLAIAHLVRQRLSQVDAGLWPHHLPEMAATEAEIASVEAFTNEALPAPYREFLAHANGLKAVFQAVDLFGTQDLKRLGSSQDRVDAVLDGMEPLFPVLGVERAELLPIAMSGETIDLFLIGKNSSRKPGKVFWVAGHLVDEFPDFEEFFLAMIDYNRADVRDFENERR